MHGGLQLLRVVQVRVCCRWQPLMSRGRGGVRTFPRILSDTGADTIFALKAHSGLACVSFPPELPRRLADVGRHAPPGHQRLIPTPDSRDGRVSTLGVRAKISATGEEPPVLIHGPLKSGYPEPLSTTVLQGEL